MATSGADNTAREELQKKSRELLHLVRFGTVQSVREFLDENPIDLRAPPDFGKIFIPWNSFLSAARDPNIIKLLLERGADVNQRSNRGTTPLSDAYIAGPDKVYLLLKAGADPNIQDNDGFTPLMEVVRSLVSGRDSNNIQSLLILIGYGADTNIRTNSGKTLRQVADKSILDKHFEMYPGNRNLAKERGVDPVPRVSQFVQSILNFTTTGDSRQLVTDMRTQGIFNKDIELMYHRFLAWRRRQAASALWRSIHYGFPRDEAGTAEAGAAAGAAAAAAGATMATGTNGMGSSVNGVDGAGAAAMAANVVGPAENGSAGATGNTGASSRRGGSRRHGTVRARKQRKRKNTRRQ